jgi:hypothetical protein
MPATRFERKGHRDYPAGYAKWQTLRRRGVYKNAGKPSKPPARRQSKRIKDLADIARLLEAHPDLWDSLTDELKRQLQPSK